MYEFIVRIDGHDERRLAYRVMPAIGTQMAVGPATPGPGLIAFPTREDSPAQK
jgi:hypothetical protein